MNQLVLSAPVLDIQHLTKTSAGKRVFADVHIQLARRDIIAINGLATDELRGLFDCISGVAPADTGAIILSVGAMSYNMAGSPEYLFRLRGIGRIQRDVRLFPAMTVLETVVMTVRYPAVVSVMASLLNVRHVLAKECEVRTKALALLKHMKLDTLADQRVGSLSYVLQRRLEVTALMALNPAVLILDAFAAGCDTNEIPLLAAIIDDAISEFAVAVILGQAEADMLQLRLTHHYTVSG